MARKRLSDVAAIVNRPVDFPAFQTMEVRKIENGHVMRHSGTNADGEYFSREVFSKEHPGLGIGGMPSSGNVLSDAKKALK